MHRIVAIAVMSFRRLLRTRILAVALVLAALVPGTYSAILIPMIVAGKSGHFAEIQSMLPMFFSMVVGTFGIVASLIALIIGVTLVRREMTDGTIYGVLSKPVSRGEYVMGNALGGFGMLTSVWILFGLVLMLVGAIVGSPLQPMHYAVVAGHLLRSSIALTVALLFSTRFNPWGAAALTVLVVNGVGIVKGSAGLLGAFGLTVPSRIVDVLCFPFPVMDSLSGLTLGQSSLAPAPVAPGFIHLLDYAVVMVILTYFSFRRLELNRTAD